MINKKHIKGTGILTVLVIMLSSYVSAFGVGAPYYDGNPLEMSAGHTKEVVFNLQNMPGPEDINFKADVLKGSDIMSLVSTQNSYSLPVGGSVDVVAKVTIPSNANVGDSYDVQISFTTITPGTAGALGLGSSVSRIFKVVVVPEVAPPMGDVVKIKKGTPFGVYLLIVAVIAIVITLVILLKKEKKK